MLAMFVSSAVLSISPGSAAAADKTTKYRVYQDNKLLTETQDYQSAEAYAGRFTNSHVEQIGTREWVWHNYPRYKVYQHGYSTSKWEFATLDQAIREASKWSNASVRDLQGGGWVWNNYARYRLYQGDTTLGSSWEFAMLDQAKREAAKWSNAHIIDLKDNRWVWDNIPQDVKTKQRASGDKTYQVYQGTYTQDGWSFATLEEAIGEALRWGNSSVVRTDSGKEVFSNAKKYRVYQYDNYLDSFVGLDEAIRYAERFGHSKIINDNAPASYNLIWNNYPYYQVYQKDTLIGDSTTIEGALKFARQFANSSIRRLDGGSVIWDNIRNLQFWGWNGSSSDATIRSHVNNTAGLDVVSPTYFQLADASGGLQDSSSNETVAWLKQQGYAVHPLVANQFDTALTTKFLADADARKRFVEALVNRLTELGADGINVDFESVAGSDRANFTLFMQELAAAAHAKGLLVSVDLPRGSAAWNAKTAFDHEKLAGIADYIITMTYDQHWKGGTEAGSVAGLQWVEEGVQEFLAYGIPRDKLIMGIPFYVREWQIDSSGKLVSNRALLMKDLPALIQEKNAKQTWDSRFNQYKVEYQEGGYTYVFWLEDEKTVKERIAIAKKYELAGVAAWRLGYDSSELWQMMIQEK